MYKSVLIGMFAMSYALSASAEPRKELHAALLKNLHLKSFTAKTLDLTNNTIITTIEFQAPDRFKISAADKPPSFIIGGTMYHQMEGKYTKIMVGKELLGQYRNEAAIADLEKGVKVENIGQGVIGHEPARKYRFVIPGKQEWTFVAWVGMQSGYVLQWESSGKAGTKRFAMRVLYSDFNSPSIKIIAPAIK